MHNLFREKFKQALNVNTLRLTKIVTNDNAHSSASRETMVYTPENIVSHLYTLH